MTAPDKSPPQVIHGNGGYSRPECPLIIGSLRSIGGQLESLYNWGRVAYLLDLGRSRYLSLAKWRKGDRLVGKIVPYLSLSILQPMVRY